jgi:hypothetical protein
MKKRLISAILGLTLIPTIGLAQAQRHVTDVKVAQAGSDKCRKQVRDYVGTIQFLRDTAGSQVGDRVAGSFVRDAEEQRVASARGFCAAAQLLQEKGLPN